MKLFKLLKRLIVLAVVVVAACFIIDFFLYDEDPSDETAYEQNYSDPSSNYDHLYDHVATSASDSNDDIYSNSGDYDDDSWSVIDYLLSFLGDDYGVDADYDNYYDNDNYSDYDNYYDYDYDYDDEPESPAIAHTQTPKPTVTTTSSGNTSNQTAAIPVSVSNQRKNFIEYALSLKGTPYVWGGKTPSPGLDCSGFVAFAARKAINVNFTGSAQNMYNNAKKISIDSAEPGDLVFFSDSGNGITHVGIFLGKNSGQGANNQRLFVHSASGGSSTGVIVSSLDQNNYWSSHLVGAKSFLSSSDEIRTFTRSGNKKSTSSSQEDFENDSWWDDVDASWF